MDLDSLGLPVVGLGLLYARMSENERFSTLVLNVSDSRCLYFRTSEMICTWIAYRMAVRCQFSDTFTRVLLPKLRSHRVGLGLYWLALCYRGSSRAAL